MTTITMLSNVVYGNPSGNYDGSSLDWSSDPAKAANYYRGRSGIQTFGLSVSGFSGSILLEATMDQDPNNADWFVTYTYSGIVNDIRAETVLGNFSWMRAKVENFAAGTINYVTINY